MTTPDKSAREGGVSPNVIALAIALEVMANDHLFHTLDEQQQDAVVADIQKIVARRFAALRTPAEETEAEPDMMIEGRRYEDGCTADLMIRGEAYYSGPQFRAAFRHGYDFARRATTPPVDEAKVRVTDEPYGGADPTSVGDAIAGKMREYYEKHRERSWFRSRHVGADNLMLGLLNVAIRELERWKRPRERFTYCQGCDGYDCDAEKGCAYPPRGPAPAVDEKQGEGR